MYFAIVLMITHRHNDHSYYIAVIYEHSKAYLIIQTWRYPIMIFCPAESIRLYQQDLKND
jgi:hypothetical protein